MKRLFSISIIAFCALTAMAQSFEPNTKWPYLYKDFTQGTIYFEGNQKSTLQLNIHLWGNVLHYVAADGRIFESKDSKVMRVEIDKDAYIFSDHKLVEIKATNGNNLLVKLTKADFDALNSGGGAYGSSLNSSAVKELSSLDLGGLNQPELGKMLQEKNDGSIIPLSYVYYFIINGQQIEASKKSVDKYIGKAKTEDFAKFLKDKKIKWKKEDSLKEVLSFLSE